MLRTDDLLHSVKMAFEMVKVNVFSYFSNLSNLALSIVAYSAVYRRSVQLDWINYSSEIGEKKIGFYHLRLLACLS